MIEKIFSNICSIILCIFLIGSQSLCQAEPPKFGPPPFKFGPPPFRHHGPPPPDGPRPPGPPPKMICPKCKKELSIAIPPRREPPLCQWCEQKCPPPGQNRQCNQHNGYCKPKPPSVYCQNCNETITLQPPHGRAHFRHIAPASSSLQPTVHKKAQQIINDVTSYNDNHGIFQWMHEKKFQNALELLAGLMVHEQNGDQNLSEYKWCESITLSEANKNFLVCLSTIRYLYRNKDMTVEMASQNAFDSVKRLLPGTRISEERRTDTIKYMNMCQARKYCMG